MFFSLIEKHVKDHWEFIEKKIWSKNYFWNYVFPSLILAFVVSTTVLSLQIKFEAKQQNSKKRTALAMLNNEIVYNISNCNTLINNNKTAIEKSIRAWVPSEFDFDALKQSVVGMDAIYFCDIDAKKRFDLLTLGNGLKGTIEITKNIMTNLNIGNDVTWKTILKSEQEKAESFISCADGILPLIKKQYEILEKNPIYIRVTLPNDSKVFGELIDPRLN